MYYYVQNSPFTKWNTNTCRGSDTWQTDRNTAHCMYNTHAAHDIWVTIGLVLHQMRGEPHASLKTVALTDFSRVQSITHGIVCLGRLHRTHTFRTGLSADVGLISHLTLGVTTNHEMLQHILQPKTSFGAGDRLYKAVSVLRLACIFNPLTQMVPGIGAVTSLCRSTILLTLEFLTTSFRLFSARSLNQQTNTF